MNTYLPHRFLACFALLILTIASGLASPAEEISQAVIAGGASSVESATPVQFVRAYNSVLIRVKEAKRCEYLTAAVKLRTDLAPQITAATLRAHQPGLNDTCDWVDPLIRCAIVAAPTAKDAIVRAAIQAQPYARECILSAAGIDNGTQVAFRPRGVDAGNINSSSLGSINPGNISSQGNVQSGNQDRVTICHNGNTLNLPRPAAEAHIRNHPGDSLGPCQ